MKNSKNAFTLIELLVVIVIIAILAGIALPVFGKVMEKGKGTKDLNNMKQIGLGLLTYINDNDDFLPDESKLAWADTLISQERLQGTKIFISSFDGRPEIATSPFPVSFGLNSDMTGTTVKRNTGKYKNTSSLILMAPAPSGGTPAKLIFTGMSTGALLTRPAGAAAKMGTMSNGNTIGAMFADFHVENVKWADYLGTGSTPKVYWKTDGTNAP